MSKYLDHIGKNLPKYANSSEDQYGWNPFAEGGALEVLNPFTAVNYYKKKGVSGLPSAFIDEAKDYKSVRENISDRPSILRRIVKKMRDVPFNQSLAKKIMNYRDSGWANVVSMSPTSKAEAYAVVAAMYYMTGNIYGKQELISSGDTFLNESSSASSSKDIKGALDVLNNGVSKLNKDAKSTGAIPSWYNLFGKINKAMKGDTAFDSINKYAKAMNSKDEIAFAEAMRTARMEDSSPMGQLVGVFSVAIGGIVLFFTAPIWMPIVGNAASSVVRSIPGIAKGAGKVAKKVGDTTKNLVTKTGKSIGDKTKNSIQDIGANLIEKAKEAAENFDTKKFSENINEVMKNLQDNGKEINQETLMQSQEVKKMLQEYMADKTPEKQDAAKQEMKKLLKQVLMQMNQQKQETT